MVCDTITRQIMTQPATTLVRQLAHLGATARWVNRFVPVIIAEADPKTCTPYPFAHLMLGQRQALRAAYAVLLKERVARNAPPVLLPPPHLTDTATGAGPWSSSRTAACSAEWATRACQPSW